MTPKILKILALCSAVALGGGYVWWSQKKAEEVRAHANEEADRATLPGSKSPVLSGETKFQFEEVPLTDPRTHEDGILPDPDEEEERVILPSSKSGLVRPVPRKEEPKQRTVLPGSKSIDRILQPPADNKPNQP